MVKQKIAEKRNIKKRWQIIRDPNDNQILKKAAKEISYQVKTTGVVQSYLLPFQGPQHNSPLMKADDDWARTNQEKATNLLLIQFKQLKKKQSCFSRQQQSTSLTEGKLQFQL